MDQKIESLQPNIYIDKVDKEIKLDPGELGATLECIITDKDGNSRVVYHDKAKSFVRQFMEILATQVTQMTDYGYNYENIAWIYARDWGNVQNQILRGNYSFFSNAGIGSLSGIMVGTGSTPPTINNYVMEAVIAHGGLAGQLQFSAVSFGAPASNVNTSQFTITRNFANASGGTITVYEIGLYTYPYWGRVATYYYCLTIRDVIGVGVVILNGETLTINYRLQAVI